MLGEASRLVILDYDDAGRTLARQASDVLNGNQAFSARL